MRILSRRFLASYLGIYASTLSLSLLLALLLEMLVHIDDVVEHRATAGGALRYLALRVGALYARDLLSAASFLAALLAFGLAARRRELLAAAAGGIPPLRLALAPLAAASVLSGAALIVDETLLLHAGREFHRIENPRGYAVFRRDSFWYHRDGTLYNVHAADRDARQLREVRSYTRDARGRLIRSMRADTVSVQEDEGWLAASATVMEFDPAHPERAPRIRRLENAVIDAGSSRDLVQLEAGADSLSLPELLRLVGAGSGRGPAAQPYRVRLHERLAEPVKLFVFALLAIPLGFSVERSRSLAAAAARGIAALALFTLAWRAGVLFATSGFASATFAPWLVLAACAALSGWRLLRPAR